ncbi:DegV family protein [Streptococcus catagoni]|uniref:DegV family protein n=1 Tax=Streptococcus catagoni TaxID=2654874 RepID=UPI00140DE762|nr:DegV family protein [Streptococcus catagoni]
MKLAVITDNTTDVPPELVDNSDLYILDIPIIIGDQTFYEGKNIDLDEFYQKMAASTELPKTSQPSLSALDDLLSELPAKGYTHVIGLFLAGGISGFWQNIQFLVDEHPDLNIAFPDSKIASVPVGLMLRNVLEWNAAGYSFEEVIERLQIQIDGTSAFVLVDDLNHLVKGGRLSNGSAILGNLLSIKPILYFNDEGKIVVYEKVRTEKKALKRLVELLNDQNDKADYEFSIIHADGEEKANLLKDMLIESGLPDKFTEAKFSAVVGTHLGSNAVALGFTPIMK